MKREKKEIQLNSEVLKFIENIAGVYEGYGIPRIGGRIFGLCLSVATPLSAEEMAELLQASRSSISTNIRGLIANGWVDKVTFSGDRTDYYQFCPMAWERVLEHRKKGLIPLWKIAQQGQDALDPEEPAREQLKEMSEWINLQIQCHDEMIAAWKEYRNKKNLGD
ncbi:hypothetical protein [Clostridium sp.]|uniref:GbsR/MarR family transcriptional regulator n=1 Tax=Clostridium sp. TaxID=1506 RepID=UPI002FC8E92E